MKDQIEPVYRPFQLAFGKHHDLLKKMWGEKRGEAKREAEENDHAPRQLIQKLFHRESISRVMTLTLENLNH